MEINETTINKMIMEPTVLDDYLKSIQHKRAILERISYWQDALLRLRNELELAQTDGDTNLAAELERIVDVFQSALAGVGRQLHLNADLATLAQQDRLSEPRTS